MKAVPMVLIRILKEIYVVFSCSAQLKMDKPVDEKQICNVSDPDSVREEAGQTAGRRNNELAIITKQWMITTITKTTTTTTTTTATDHFSDWKLCPLLLLVRRCPHTFPLLLLVRRCPPICPLLLLVRR